MGDFSKGGVHKTDGGMMGDFSKGGVHKTDGMWWVIFQRGEYIKPMAFDGSFFKGGSTQNWWVLECILLLLKIKRPGGFISTITVLALSDLRKKF